MTNNNQYKPFVKQSVLNGQINRVKRNVEEVNNRKLNDSNAQFWQEQAEKDKR